MIPFAEAFDDLLTALAADALAQLEGVPEADLNGWKPAQGLEDINTFYALATHLVGAGEYWILHAAAGRPTERDRPSEFVATGTLADLRGRYDRWLADSRSVLATLSEADLARVVERTPIAGGETERSTAAWCLLHALEHTAEHVGHLQIQRQLWNNERGGTGGA